jgi:hypothetical protein
MPKKGSNTSRDARGIAACIIRFFGFSWKEVRSRGCDDSDTMNSHGSDDLQPKQRSFYARRSRVVKNSPFLRKRAEKGDGDVWVERLGKNRNTGSVRVYFQSRNTGKRCRDEPPSGAQNIIWRNYSARWREK